MAGAPSRVRAAGALHAGHSQGSRYCAIGRIVVKGPQAGQL
jgi:hypothetical protein